MAAEGGTVLLALYTPELFLQEDGVLRYRTASGTVLPVYRSFQDLQGLSSRLESFFRIEEQRTVPVRNLSLDHYVLRPE
jgi:hypothetical protein